MTRKKLLCLRQLIDYIVLFHSMNKGRTTLKHLVKINVHSRVAHQPQCVDTFDILDNNIQLR